MMFKFPVEEAEMSTSDMTDLAVFCHAPPPGAIHVYLSIKIHFSDKMELGGEAQLESWRSSQCTAV